MSDEGQSHIPTGPDSLVSPYLDPSLAETCDHLALPHQFAAPAEALVTKAELVPGDIVLDVGSGTGAVAVPATRVVGPTGRVIALDASAEMLRQLRAKNFHCTVAGQVPGLPFGDNRFDAVLASFVLSHLADYGLALEAMVRVLRPGGRIGVTAWAPAETECAQLWKDIVGRFVHLDELLQGFRSFVPWDEWFSDAKHLEHALGEAGLIQVDVSEETFHVRSSVSDYLTIRRGSVEGTLVRRTLDSARWDLLADRLFEEFARRFDLIEYSRPVLFALGRKPASEAQAHGRTDLP